MSTTRKRFYKASELYLRIPIQDAAKILSSKQRYHTCVDYDGEHVDITRIKPDEYHVDPAWEYYAV